MTQQSTTHIMMMEPADFHSNPETMETNQYQAPDPSDISSVHRRAVEEFRALRDTLVERGVVVTTALGQKGSPDDIFCNNWVSTHPEGRMILYPMLAENRQRERRPELLDILGRSYDVLLNLSTHEKEGRFLESTGSLAMDRVNGVIYSGLSDRTNKDLAQQAAKALGYDIEFFNTRNHAGKPVYHTDVLMFIGSGYAGICSECILPEDRARVMARLGATHEVIELSMDQLRAFCGNALEVRGTGDRKYLAMSGSAHRALTEDQKAVILRHVSGIVHSDISTIEKYGGGSVRCMLLELH
ncbi:MAG: hypothetical protein K9G62_03095 [Alphaproteobacteria bacterium]|nr:hypothetical protein [Alphaproteobacteria bacterium]